MLYQIIILEILILGSTNGSFTFDNIPLKKELPCNGSTNLIWNYTTDETVTVIEWYKQPGVLIARIFGVNVGGPIMVQPPYNTAPYSVTLYEPSKYNAAIRIMGVTSADSGLYSVNITAASPQSAILSRKFLTPLTEKPEIHVNGYKSEVSCFSPPSAENVTISLMKNGNISSDNGSMLVTFTGEGTYECCLTGGNADCTNEPLCNSFRETSAISGNNKTLQWQMNVLPQPSDTVKVVRLRTFPDNTNIWSLFSVYGPSLTIQTYGVSDTGNTNISTGNIEFTLENITVEDAGFYGTYIYNFGTGRQFQENTGVAMVVYDEPSKPTIMEIESPVAYRSMSLVCSSLTNSKPDGHSLEMKYKWYLNGTEVPAGDRHHIYGSRLLIDNIERRDTDFVFTCKSFEIDTLLSDVSNEYTVIVKYGPKTVNISSGTPQHYSLVENIDTLGPITCSADCIPACTYQWFYNSVHIDGVRNTLTINNIQLTSAGNYWCRASNMYSTAISKIITVTVLHGPKTVNISPGTPQHYSLVENTDTLGPVTCNADCVPACTYQWQFNGVHIGGVSDKLTINNTQLTSAGTYRCTASNMYSSAISKIITVTVLHPQYEDQFMLDMLEADTYPAVALTLPVTCALPGSSDKAICSTNACTLTQPDIVSTTKLSSTKTSNGKANNSTKSENGRIVKKNR